MEENKIDKIIKQKLDGRSLNPSLSAWERLESQLNETETKSKNKKNYKFFIVAASIALLLSMFLFNYNLTNTQEFIKNEEKVLVEKKSIEEPALNTIELKNKIDVKEFEDEEKLLATKTTIKPNNNKVKKVIVTKTNKEKTFDEMLDSNAIFKLSEPLPNKKSIIKNKSRIRVNGDDLLYAVTHSKEEVIEYYAKLKLNRKDVLNTIKKQLKLSDLKIDPETILAEVEKSIENDEFEGGDLMQKLKIKISDIVVAIADRNK